MVTTTVTTAPLKPSLPTATGHRSESRIKRSGSCGIARFPIRIKPRKLVCAAAALNVTCSASGQTQTITREASTITQAPVHSKEKSPLLDDGGSGFPPRDDGGGGGGGGGGGNWSGGFFLFGFLAFLGFLKDKEGEEDYRDSRRR